MSFAALAGKGAEAGRRLAARGEKIAVSESSAGGLISAALLAAPGASAWFAGGAVVYSPRAGRGLLQLTREDMAGLRSATEPYAAKLAATVAARHGVTWGLAETGAAGPSGNGFGDPAGHACLAVHGPVLSTRTIRTGSADRQANMFAFAAAALDALLDALE